MGHIVQNFPLSRWLTFVHEYHCAPNHVRGKRELRFSEQLVYGRPYPIYMVCITLFNTHRGKGKRHSCYRKQGIHGAFAQQAASKIEQQQVISFTCLRDFQ
jgi:hypothetical protein